MKKKIEQLLRLNIEIEGQLRILADRDSQTAKEILAEKTAAFYTAINELLGKDDTNAIEPLQISEIDQRVLIISEEETSVNAQETTETVETEEPTEANETPTADDATEGETEGETEVVTETEAETEESASETECEISENETDEDDNQPSASEGDTYSDIVTWLTNKFGNKEDSASDEAPIKEETGTFEEDSETEETQSEDEDYDELTEPVAEEPEDADTHQETLSESYAEMPHTLTVAEMIMKEEQHHLDEVLAGHEHKSLQSAFTLNDKYRFIKGIFSDDKDEFDGLLNHLSEYENLSDVYDYLLNELGWDVDNEEVLSFINIIAKYFNEQ